MTAKATDCRVGIVGGEACQGLPLVLGAVNFLMPFRPLAPVFPAEAATNTIVIKASLGREESEPASVV